MPAAQSAATQLINVAAGGLTDQASPHFDGLTYDHVLLFITLDCGTTTVDLDLQFSYDTNVGWFDVYDANQTQVSQQFTGTFTGALYLSTQNANTRMTPAPIAAPAWRIYMDVTGTDASSTLDLRFIPFTLGTKRK